MPKRGQIIPPEAYPQIVTRSQAVAISRKLKSPDTVVQGSRVIGGAKENLRAATLGYVAELEQAGQDLDRICDRAHEIRGFAETAGLGATGRLANGVCRYFDESDQLGVGPDGAIVALYVSAITQAARAEEKGNAVSDVIAKELFALVNHKLTEIKTILG